MCRVYAEIRFQLTSFKACNRAIGDGLSVLWNYFEVSISRGQLAPEERFPGTFVHDRQRFKPAVSLPFVRNGWPNKVSHKQNSIINQDYLAGS